MTVIFLLCSLSNRQKISSGTIISHTKRGEANESGADLVLQIILTVAVISDFRSDKIPNGLIAVGLGSGMIWRLWICEDAWYQVVLGIGCPAAVLFFLFLMHALGAGDIKLFSVIGCFWPIHDLIFCMMLSMVAGAVISISKLLIHKQLLESLSCFYHYVQSVYQTKKVEKYPGRDIKKRQMHFSLAIYIGFFLVLGVKYGKVFYSYL